MLSRRGLITGLISFVAAPAIVRAIGLMSLRGCLLDETWEGIELYPMLTFVRIEDKYFTWQRSDFHHVTVKDVQ